MANVLAPFGFRVVGRLDGAAWTANLSVRQIASTNTTAIFSGDPVTSLNTGYIARSTPGTSPIAGIFTGCKYLSISQGRTVWNHFWPGSDANGDVEAYIVNDPWVVMMVQANAGPVVQDDIGANANFAVGTGNTATGVSGASLDVSTIGNTATLPFRIVGLNTGVGNGTDTTSQYNYVFVAFNNQDFKTMTGLTPG